MPATKFSLSRFVSDAFKPPFYWLAPLVWVYFVLCFVLHPHSPIWHYNFLDTDDYLYMVQAIDGIRGQGWYDMIQHRMNPPDGTFVHFSHMLSWLYALPILALQPWMGTLKAATFSAALFPVLYFAAFLWIARWAAEPLIDRDWTRFTAYTTIFSFSIIFQFIPGRVDHHGLEGLLALLAFGFAARTILNPGTIKMAVATAATLSLALVIGLEVLPVLLLIIAWIGLWAAIKGGTATRSGIALSITLLIGNIVFLLINKPPSMLGDTSVEVYSLTYVILAAGIVLCFLGVHIATRLTSSIIARLAISGVVAAALGAGFILSFPALKGGPYGGVDPVISAMILERAREAWSLIYARNGLPALPGLVVLVTAPIFLRRQKGDARWAGTLLILLIAMTLGLGIFYQQRLIVYTGAFVVIPLASLAQHMFGMAAKQASMSLKRDMTIFTWLLVGPLIPIIIAALFGNYPNSMNVIFFPVQVTQKTCDENGLVEVLNTRYGDKPHLIMNTMGDSVEILFRTPHSILAAPFHMNVSGNIDVYHFFTATDWDEAEKIVRKRGADLVVMCDVLEPIYKDVDPHDPRGKPNPDFLAQQLIDGDEMPDWLTEVDDDRLGHMMLFEVNKPDSTN